MILLHKKNNKLNVPTNNMEFFVIENILRSYARVSVARTQRKISKAFLTFFHCVSVSEPKPIWYQTGCQTARVALPKTSIWTYHINSSF